MEKSLLEELYYLMLLGRNFEYAAKEHYLQGDISGFLHLDIGQEAFSVGAMKAFKGDVFTAYREHVMALARGIEPEEIMAGQTIMAHPTFSEALERTFFRL